METVIKYNELTLFEKLTLFPQYLYTQFKVLQASVVGLFRGSDASPDYTKYVAYSKMRAHTRFKTVHQMQYMMPTTDQNYLTFASRNGIKAESEVFDNGTTKLHWLGDKNAKQVIMYCPGGGYIMPSSLPHYEFLWNLQIHLRSLGKDVAILVLSYGLSPKVQYPGQLRKAASALNYVIHTLHKDPSNIIIGGDSAGANLVLALLSHLSHPHPSGIPPVKLTSPLAGIFVMAPFVKQGSKARSFVTNLDKDIINPAVSKSWNLQTFGPNTAADPYIQALIAPPGWWADVPVENVMVMVGSNEVFYDDVVEIQKKMKAEAPGKITAVIVEKETHSQPTLDLMIGCKAKSQHVEIIEKWMNARLS